MIAWQKVGMGIAALIAPLGIVADTGIAHESVLSNAIAQTTAPTLLTEEFENLSEDEFRYFQTMGPLEYATRLSGTPETPAWRVRLRLYPQDLGTLDGFTYEVKLDHYNLSPALYQEVVSSYGMENTDPSLNDQTHHQHLDMVFIPIMGVAADLLPELTQFSKSLIVSNPLCGEALGCADLRHEDDAEWAVESSIQLEVAPWETDIEPVFAMTRALAKQAGWLQANDGYGQWDHGEIPEGVSAERPWVEVFVENYIGNGGVYFAEWTERAADDSISAIVHRIYYFPNAEGEAQAHTGYVCARGPEAGTIRSICP
ncbi:hypothetical protein PN498_25985 [Oscillatoria sp. CS-180]|uniref:hypothetical protein n=1 Tax=Oscillatoria sp. CS-180 TaxID=3021720 RepID=UPI00232C2EF6|nr:hypothetical protein [Oscillatoria sp. CS-180]MDB9529467.1 hypothetical protein [Oscillatoria sp. CS-180]